MTLGHGAVLALRVFRCGTPKSVPIGWQRT